MLRDARVNALQLAARHGAVLRCIAACACSADARGAAQPRC
jgi:O-acetyl-ADP-ribose deacetylase (regulator of RNase III)